MGKQQIVKLTLVAALVLPWSTQLRAEPESCNPKVAMTLPESTATASGWFSQLFAQSDKPQPFAGAVMDDPDPGCSLSVAVRSIVSAPTRRERIRAAH